MDEISAKELKTKRFQLLEDIAKELEGEIIFPTCFDVSVRISKVMRSDSAGLKEIAHEIQHDPLVTSKVLRLANSATYNPSAQATTDLEKALSRTGINAARSVALACALAQLAQANKTSVFAGQLNEFFIHSLKTAAIAQVLAKQFTPRITAESALLAGLVHDLGAFFMLHRVSDYQELVERPQTAAYLVAQWHESIGAVLLDALNLPDEIIEAVKETDIPRLAIKQPRNLSDIIYIANLFAGGFAEMQKLDLPDLIEPAELQNPNYTQLQAAMDQACKELLDSWR